MDEIGLQKLRLINPTQSNRTGAEAVEGGKEGVPEDWNKVLKLCEMGEKLEGAVPKVFPEQN